MALLIAEQKQTSAYIDECGDLSIFQDDGEIVTISQQNIAQFLVDLQDVYIAGYLGD